MLAARGLYLRALHRSAPPPAAALHLDDGCQVPMEKRTLCLVVGGIRRRLNIDRADELNRRAPRSPVDHYLFVLQRTAVIRFLRWKAHLLSTTETILSPREKKSFVIRSRSLGESIHSSTVVYCDASANSGTIFTSPWSTPSHLVLVARGQEHFECVWEFFSTMALAADTHCLLEIITVKTCS